MVISSEYLERLIAPFPVISFDFYDTLFFRLTPSPETIFDIIGENFSIRNFRNVRIKAQSDAFIEMKTSGKNEITISDIYRHINIPGTNLEKVKEYELHIEKFSVFPDPALYQLFQNARTKNKKILILSDMYLPAATLGEICAAHNLIPDEIFVSCEIQATKRDRGDLFDYVAQKLELDPNDILHIGDDLKADKLMSANKGWNALHYEKLTLYRPLQRSSTAAGSLLVNYLSARSILIRDLKTDREKDPLYLTGFYCSGPGLYAFSSWIKNKTSEDNPDILALISRDGFLLNEIFNIEPLHIPHVYLKGSRIAFALALTNEKNFDENIELLLSGPDHLYVSDYFKRIGVPLPPDSMLGLVNLKKHEKIHGNLRKNIRTLFVLYKREILQACLNSKRNLYNYLLKLGFRDEMKVGFVDLGWQGSTQSFFERLVAELFNASVTGYYFCYIGDKKFSKTRKSLLPVEKKDNGIVNQLYNNRRLAELLFSAPHGTIIAYGTSGKNGSTNVMPIEDWGAANFDVKLAAERLNSGALDSYSTVKNWLEISNIKISEYDLARLFCKQIADPPHAIKESTDWLGNLDSWSAAR